MNSVKSLPTYLRKIRTARLDTCTDRALRVAWVETVMRNGEVLLDLFTWTRSTNYANRACRKCRFGITLTFSAQCIVNEVIANELRQFEDSVFVNRSWRLSRHVSRATRASRMPRTWITTANVIRISRADQDLTAEYEKLISAPPPHSPNYVVMPNGH